MQDRKFRVLTTFFPYGGNGAAPSEHPAIRNWYAKAAVSMSKNPLVQDFGTADFADTPITMTRNQAVLQARKDNADILIMVDSDMVPDLYLDKRYGRTESHVSDPKPFIDVALETIAKNYERGPVVIAAPYCGPPPYEAPYVFTWDAYPNDAADPNIQLRMFTRKEAAAATGISEAAALPTGLIAYDMRVFKHAEPKPGDRGWFYYEFTDHYHAGKGGTEDVMCTRDLSMAVQRDLGYNPLLVAWDCWAGHVKPWTVGKPKPVCIGQIEPRFRRAVEEGIQADERVLDIGGDQPTNKE